MRKNLLMLIVFFIVGGTVAFTQEVRYSDTGGVTNQSPWYYKLEIAAGGQMGFILDEDENWTTSPAVFIGFRHYLRPVFRSLVMGYSVFGTVSFPKERVWKSPNDQPISFTRDNTDLRYGLGGFLGASLQGRMFGPVGIVLDAGLIGNLMLSRSSYSWSPQYQGKSIQYNIFDLGVGLNGGLQYSIGRFSLEAGAKLGYSFFRRDIYQVYDSRNSSDKLDSGSRNGVANIIRADPYIMVGMMW